MITPAGPVSYASERPESLKRELLFYLQERFNFHPEDVGKIDLEITPLFEDKRRKNIDEIAFHCGMILQLLGQDLEDENLRETPRRMARYLLEFLNYDPGNYETTFESIQTDQLVMVKDIPFWSLCSHHLLAFQGTASVGYLTGSKVVGLSKIPRIVQKHAHKLQLQERLAHDIADELEGILVDSPGVGVFIKAKHSCMAMRGIRSDGEMITSVMRGAFLNDQSTKEEFLLLVR